MKRIITLFDVLNTPWNVVHFAIKLAKEKLTPITGVFLAGRVNKTPLRYPFPNDMALTEDDLSQQSISHEQAVLIDDNIKLFNDACANEGVNSNIRKDVLIKDFIGECSEKDLIIADTRADFLDEFLPRVTCPVYLTSENELPEKVLLMLDEGVSSRNAIEKFIAVLPGYSSLPADVVSVNLSDEQVISNREYIKHHVSKNFSQLTENRLEGNVETELLKFLTHEDAHIMVVMGAFGRSGISRFFKNSLANVILEKTRLSLFIVHK
ncbi:MAG: universal stress protein [Ginsengibacter sp.]